MREQICVGSRGQALLSGLRVPAGDLNTADISLISHTHGRLRRAERAIDKSELQAGPFDTPSFLSVHEHCYTMSSQSHAPCFSCLAHPPCRESEQS